MASSWQTVEYIGTKCSCKQDKQTCSQGCKDSNVQNLLREQWYALLLGIVMSCDAFRGSKPTWRHHSSLSLTSNDVQKLQSSAYHSHKSRHVVLGSRFSRPQHHSTRHGWLSGLLPKQAQDFRRQDNYDSKVLQGQLSSSISAKFLPPGPQLRKTLTSLRPQDIYIYTVHMLHTNKTSQDRPNTWARPEQQTQMQLRYKAQQPKVHWNHGYDDE